MKLYHYTTFTNFCAIWIQQKLNFSLWTNCNDIYEREKIYRLSQQSAVYNGKKFPAEVFRLFKDNVFKEVEQYRQISFCVDSKDCEGYASPMMWGHYARDYQRSGVCIEIDSSKINFPKGVYKRKVSYKKKLEPTHIYGVNAESEDAAQTFVIKNKNNLFFRKHRHWDHENEYRMVTKNKECEALDISGAITHVYILGEDDITRQAIRSIVGDTKMISYLYVGGLNGLSLLPMNLHDKEELEYEINYINKNHVNIWKGEWSIPKFKSCVRENKD